MIILYGLLSYLLGWLHLEQYLFKKLPKLLFFVCFAYAVLSLLVSSQVTNLLGVSFEGELWFASAFLCFGFYFPYRRMEIDRNYGFFVGLVTYLSPISALVGALAFSLCRFVLEKVHSAVLVGVLFTLIAHFVVYPVVSFQLMGLVAIFVFLMHIEPEIDLLISDQGHAR